MEARLLEILSCPINKVPLKKLSPKRLDKLNQAISSDTLMTTNGKTISQALNAALIGADNKFIYPIRDNRPELLPEQAIATLQINNF